MTESYLPATGRVRVTALYDPILALTMRERSFRPAVVAAALARSPETILDIGCGTGTQAAALARHASVTGIDADPEILRRARSKAPGVTFIEGTAQALPVDDAAFDCAVTTLVLHHLGPETKRAALGEMARVLRPGGRLVIADWGRPRDPLTAAGFLALRALDGFEPTRDHAAGRIAELVAAAGFADVRTEQRWRTPWGVLELISATR